MMTENKFRCKSCSKEDVSRVPIMRVIEKLDAYLSKNDLDGALSLLKHWENEARAFDDKRGLLEILNELIGLARQLGNRDLGVSSAEEAFKIIEQENSQNAVSSGTIYVNGATTYKAFGLAKESLPYYKKAEKIFEENDVEDFRRAALLNNMASAYSELGEFSSAEENYFKAIELLKSSDSNDGEIAVSYVNLAHLYYEQDAFDERAEKMLDIAWEYLHSERIVHDGNYAFICSKCAPSYDFFGYFLRKAELLALADKIYDRS